VKAHRPRIGTAHAPELKRIALRLRHGQHP
jgi:hypothetical protein